MRFLLILIFSLLTSGSLLAATAPDFGPNVLVIDPSDANAQAAVDAVFAKQERAQFGSERYAILLKPGKHALDVQVGFYTQVLGLGSSPDDVRVTGAVRSTAKWFNGNATCNFWRSVENLSVDPTLDKGTDVWAVSQATAMRRVHILGDLHLWDGGWSSGGFLADSKIDGKVVSGSQQQWLSRNCDWGKWDGGVWNMVFVGVNYPPSGEWPKRPYTVIEKTPIGCEKPFLSIDESGRYSVVVPAKSRNATRGVSWSSNSDSTERLDIDRFYIARADRDDAKSINAALSRGLNLILAPGIYHLDEPLMVERTDAVVLGLGYATLVPTTGKPAMKVGDADGVQIAGLIFEAGAMNSPTLLEVGRGDTKHSHAANPISLFDLCCRAGGADVGRCDSFVTINSSNVVGDNFWLWRADHGKGAAWNENKVDNGLIVNGNDVTIYGLFVEHTQGYQTLWNGNGGRVYMYQSELPYDPPTQSDWMNGKTRGFASYKIADTVTSHEVWGLGVYSVFKRDGIICDSAVEAPGVPGVKLHHLTIHRLNKPGAGIAHILNGEGDGAIDTSDATKN